MPHSEEAATIISGNIEEYRRFQIYQNRQKMWGKCGQIRKNILILLRLSTMFFDCLETEILQSKILQRITKETEDICRFYKN